MKASEYQLRSARLDREYPDVQQRFSEEFNTRMTHYTMGISTEAAELLDLVKKNIMYGKKIDSKQFLDESGDVIWYMSQLLTLLGYTFDDVFKYNYEKLNARYDGEFSEQAALERKDEEGF